MLAEGRSPDWSPDGEQIAFICNSPEHSLCLMNSDGSDLQILPVKDAEIPRWSPDGRKIAFSSGYRDPSTNRDYMVVHIFDLNTQQELADDIGPQSFGMACGGNGIQAQWSGDSQWLIFWAIPINNNYPSHYVCNMEGCRSVAEIAGLGSSYDVGIATWLPRRLDK